MVAGPAGRIALGARDVRPAGPARTRPMTEPVDPTTTAPEPLESHGRRLARSTAVFSGATAISRVLGLAREMVSAYYFGVAGAINAFTVAIQIPNLVRALVADAALSGAFVPVFSELLERGEKTRAWRVASTLLWLTLLILGGITALFILLAPLLILLATLAGRRWGPAVGGWLAGLPLTSGPVSLILALEQGPEFAGRAALGTLFGLISLSAFSLVYGVAARRMGWPACLVAVGGTLVAPTLLPVVFGQAYSQAVLPFQIVVWMIPVAWISGHFRFSLIAAGRQDQDFVASSSGAPSSVAVELTCGRCFPERQPTSASHFSGTRID